MGLIQVFKFQKKECVFWFLNFNWGGRMVLALYKREKKH